MNRAGGLRARLSTATCSLNTWNPDLSNSLATAPARGPEDRHISGQDNRNRRQRRDVSPRLVANRGDVDDEVAEREGDVDDVIAPGRSEVLPQQRLLSRGLLGRCYFQPGRRAGVTALRAV